MLSNKTIHVCENLLFFEEISLDENSELSETLFLFFH